MRARISWFAAQLITTLTAPPYSFSWTNVPQGSYSLTARAIDNGGGATTSPPINVTVISGVAQLYYIEVDHLNTPRLVANAAGTTVWRWDQQEPFGVNVPDENPSALGLFVFPLRFPGQYADKESNLFYNYFRDYDSGIGRYAESDPVGLKGGLNTYAYVDGRPLDTMDRSGLRGITILRSWPFNGNLFPGFERQNMVCDPPMDFLNKNPCIQHCCVDHDQCYNDYSCNWTSWAYMPLPVTTLTPCGRCNFRAVQCVANRLVCCPTT